MASFEHYRNLRDIKDNPMHRHKKRREISMTCVVNMLSNAAQTSVSNI